MIKVAHNDYSVRFSQYYCLILSQKAKFEFFFCKGMPSDAQDKTCSFVSYMHCTLLVASTSCHIINPHYRCPQLSNPLGKSQIHPWYIYIYIYIYIYSRYSRGGLWGLKPPFNQALLDQYAEYYNEILSQHNYMITNNTNTHKTTLQTSIISEFMLKFMQQGPGSALEVYKIEIL